MDNKKWCTQLSTYFKRHMAFRKADESIVCLEKLLHATGIGLNFLLQSCYSINLTFSNIKLSLCLIT
jgi:hypothetical protein